MTFFLHVDESTCWTQNAQDVRMRYFNPVFVYISSKIVNYVISSLSTKQTIILPRSWQGEIGVNSNQFPVSTANVILSMIR